MPFLVLSFSVCSFSSVCSFFSFTSIHVLDLLVFLVTHSFIVFHVSFHFDNPIDQPLPCACDLHAPSIVSHLIPRTQRMQQLMPSKTPAHPTNTATATYSPTRNEEVCSGSPTAEDVQEAYVPLMPEQTTKNQHCLRIQACLVLRQQA